MFQVSKNASAIRNDKLLDQFNEDVPDERKCGYHKRCYQDYTNKQKIERITKKQNEEGDLRRRSSRSARNMGTKNMDVRSSRSQMFFKIGILKNFAKFAGKHLFQSLFLNKVACPRSELLLRFFFFFFKSNSSDCFSDVEASSDSITLNRMEK